LLRRRSLPGGAAVLSILLSLASLVLLLRGRGSLTGRAAVLLSLTALVLTLLLLRLAALARLLRIGRRLPGRAAIRPFGLTLPRRRGPLALSLASLLALAAPLGILLRAAVLARALADAFTTR
jgi:hypothetical protein